MKVLFISDALYAENEIYNHEGYANRPMLEAMPCDLLVATTIYQAREYAPQADVILLESMRGVSFRDHLGFLNSSKAFIGAFYCDVWRAPFWYQSEIRIDLNICVYREVALKVHPSWTEGKNFLWLPPRVKTVPYNDRRDVDIITWGAMGREYPFRNFTYQALLQSLVGGPRRKAEPVNVSKGVVSNAIKVGNVQYTWHQLRSKRMAGPIYGDSLMAELSRCKVCPTGPVVQNGVGSVVARFFENAAAGVVSISPYMEDAKGLGFKHGENIWISRGERFFLDLDKLLFVDTDLRYAISESAHQLIEDRHSIEVRALELYDALRSKLKG